MRYAVALLVSMSLVSSSSKRLRSFLFDDQPAAVEETPKPEKAETLYAIAQSEERLVYDDSTKTRAHFNELFIGLDQDLTFYLTAPPKASPFDYFYSVNDRPTLLKRGETVAVSAGTVVSCVLIDDPSNVISITLDTDLRVKFKFYELVETSQEDTLEAASALAELAAAKPFIKVKSHKGYYEPVRTEDGSISFGPLIAALSPDRIILFIIPDAEPSIFYSTVEGRSMAAPRGTEISVNPGVTTTVRFVDRNMVQQISLQLVTG